MDDDVLDEAARRYAEPDEVEDLVASVLARLAWRTRRGFKDCAACHEHKAPDDFGRDSSKPDGLRRYCRACVASYDADRRSA